MDKIRWSLVAVCLSVLTACGGGTDNAKPPAPAPQRDPQPEAPTGTPLSASYAVALSYDEKHLDIVDPSNAEQLFSVAVDEPDSWLTTFTRTQSSDGRTQTRQHEAALYYVENGRVKALDLARGSSSQARQVSSASDVCRIPWHIDGDLTGLNNWLAIVRAGTDTQCGTGDDVLALVHSSTLASAAITPLPFNLAEIITVGHNAAGGLESLITFNSSVGQFVHWRLDSNGAHDTPVTNGGGFTTATDVRWLGLVPGYRDRGIVQVAGSLRRITWDGLGATLTASLASANVAFGSEDYLITTDDSHLYVVAEEPGQVILAFDGTGTASRRVATLDAGKGEATALLASSDAVWVVQKDQGPATAPSTLMSFTKLAGMSRQVDRYEVPASLPAYLTLKLVGAKGTRLVYSKPSEDEDDEVSLHIVDDVAASSRPLAARAFTIGIQADRASLIGQRPEATHVIWCDRGTALSAVDCTAARFKSYNLATGTTTALGQNLTTTEALEVLDAVSPGDVHALNPFITTQYPDGVTTTLWQFEPDVAGSLKFLIARSSASGGSSSPH